MTRKDVPAYTTETSIFAERLRSVMKERGENQTSLAAKITAKYVTIQRQTISLYMNGQSKPDTERLTAIARVLDVSSDYLLGISEEPENKPDIKAACLTTGLSSKSVRLLSANKRIGLKKTANVLDFLLLDEMERETGHDFRSILDLLTFFLEYNASVAQRKQIFTNGHVADYAGGLIMKNAIALDSRIVENAVLTELQQALISLKRCKKEQLETGDINQELE